MACAGGDTGGGRRFLQARPLRSPLYTGCEHYMQLLLSGCRVLYIVTMFYSTGNNKWHAGARGGGGGSSCCSISGSRKAAGRTGGQRGRPLSGGAGAGARRARSGHAGRAAAPDGCPAGDRGGSRGRAGATGTTEAMKWAPTALRYMRYGFGYHTNQATWQQKERQR